MTIKSRKKNNKTIKKMKINGSIIGEKSGWKIVEIYGEPFKRGYAHGNLLSKELIQVQQVLPFIVKDQLNISFKKYIEKSKKLIYPIVKNKYPEFFNELRGISEGAKSLGVDITTEYLIAWNAFLSLYSYYKDGNNKRCSAFIACGDATENKDIIMAHNTHSDFATGQILNIILKVKPEKGNAFTMQTSAGLISSSSDWFLVENGIIGCETTISDINYKPIFGSPYFCRIRDTLQYANSLDECKDILLKNNAGDYACSWLFGDINKNEIMLCEFGLKKNNVVKTNNGVFYGMNSSIGHELRTVETNLDKKHNINDLSNNIGSRNKRLNDLLNEKYYGKINLENAKLIISDHYDEFLNKVILNNNSICKHSELSKKAYHEPYGSVDSKVVNSKMAKTMNFIGRFGSGCGRIFKVDDYIKKNPEYEKWKNVLNDIINNKWTKL
jgi:hypothetical protein